MKLANITLICNNQLTKIRINNQDQRFYQICKYLALFTRTQLGNSGLSLKHSKTKIRHENRATESRDQ